MALLEVTAAAERDRQTVKTIGVIGGGQLAWMMAEAATKLDLSLVVQTPKLDDPAVARVGDRAVVLGAVGDAATTRLLADRVEVITFENEFVDLAALGELARSGVCFRPHLVSLEPLLDKYVQRCFLQGIGLPVPAFAAIDDRTQASTITQWDNGDPLTFPAVLKTRRHGYDGQGTRVVADRAELLTVGDRWHWQPLILEAFVPFERELAAVAARSVQGEVVVYPIVETQQVNQVCRRVIAPAPIDPAVAQQCQAIARRLLEAIDAIGVFGIELFATADGRVSVNEVAPRTHNSGHFSIEACRVSQFEQHLRAVAGLPLGATDLISSCAAMVNLLGFESAVSDYREQRDRLAALPRATVHWYGKTSASPGRKLGHVTVLAESPQELQGAIEQIEAIWYGDRP
ncbi:MAG: 5-(carboxyamino)imidazole ribonucleotide synthase [Oscillatoriales cyanobacterium]|nr:MAG: 5-(carboxyamino)imidazole ribonucleotide synthase [Oscillatoriales cyanobacterium]